MAAVKIFQTLRDRIQKQNAMLPAEQRAMFWFKDYTTALTSWQRKFGGIPYDRLREEYQFTKQLVGANRAQPGFFYFFMYDPKWKDELPYYDRFPFMLCLSSEPGRFKGLNFHYLDYFNRARLFDLLYPFREGRGSHHKGVPAATDPHGIRDIRMQLRLTYNLLKVSSKYEAFRPCLKEYLVPHVETPLMKVGANEWDLALFLPVEMFVKENKTHVWKESQKQF